MPASLAFEELARRIQAVIHAYRVPGKPNWAGAEYFTGDSGLDDGVDPSLRHHVAASAKQDVDLESAMARNAAWRQGQGGSSASGPIDGLGDGPAKGAGAGRPPRGSKRQNRTPGAAAPQL